MSTIIQTTYHDGEKVRWGTARYKEQRRAASWLTCKAGAANILHSVVGYEELLLPPHEHGSSVGILHGQVWLLQLVADVPESREAAPVDHVFLLGRTPVSGQEAIPAADDLCVKIGGEFWPIVCQAAYAEVSTEMGEGEVNILEGGEHL